MNTFKYVEGNIASLLKEKHIGVDRPTVSAKRLISLLCKTIENHDLCVLKKKNTDILHISKSQKMVVGLKFMIRREKEVQFRNENPNLLDAMTPIIYLAQTNKIVGVDIAGNEYNEEGVVANYSNFLTTLNKHKILFTIHAGEISATSSKKMLGYKNLKESVKYGVRRLGHTVRLFDHSREMIALLKKVITDGIFIELNLTSNIWTGAVPTDVISEHTIIKALNGDHPLFESNPELLPDFKKCVLICDDDPIVVSQTTPSLVNELTQFALHINNFTPALIKNLLKKQYLMVTTATL